MNHPAIVRIGDGLANLDEDLQQPAALHFRRVVGGRTEKGTVPLQEGDSPLFGPAGRAVRVVFADDVLERLAVDEGHYVERPPFLVHAQVVHRHNPGVLELSSDLGLDQEPFLLLVQLPAQPLQGDLPADLRVVGQPDFSDPAAGVELADDVAARAELRRKRRGRHRGPPLGRRGGGRRKRLGQESGR